VTRPLSSSKVEVTAKSYSDHEALEVDLELSIGNNKKSTTSENKVRVSSKKQFFAQYIHIIPQYFDQGVCYANSGYGDLR